MQTDLIGKTFHRLQVIERVAKPTGNKSCVYWLCRCSCGGHATVSTGNLNAELVKSCGCLKRRIWEDNPNWKGCGELSHSHWKGILRHAKDRGLLVSINIEDAWKIFESQGRKCAISGLSISFDVKTHTAKTTASLDRIDSARGYVKGNVQWVHKDINLMKRSLSESRFIGLCHAVINHKPIK